MLRVDRPTAERIGELVELGKPFIVTGLLDSWGARHWTLPFLAAEFGHTPTAVRVYPRPAAREEGAREEAVPFEGECTYVHVTLADLCSWLDARPLSPSSPLARFPLDEFWGYADYQDMAVLFADAPAALAAADWGPILARLPHSYVVPAHDASATTLWLGSCGSSTPAHFDSYGVNLVAQCQGTKRWRLHPPDGLPAQAGPPAAMKGCARTGAGGRLRPTRVPYEESSVFVALELPAYPWTQGAAEPPTERPTSTAPQHSWLDVTLTGGEVLYVPRHWWHAVNTPCDTPSALL